MTCYHPKLRIVDISKWEKAQDGHLYHPARIEQPNSIWERLEDLKKNQGTQYKKEIIPCRNCIGCRLDYARQWADRGYLESKESEHNYFITLTYDEEHLPTTIECPTGTVSKEHASAFIHDLRQIMQRDYNHKGFKFMLCGEYGEEYLRPHYHAILFNIPLQIETFYAPKIINKETYYQNTIIERAWKHGISNISHCTWNNIAYTARYITKKINGKQAEDYYKGREKEFFKVSKGIGKNFYEKNKINIYEKGYDEITIKNKQGVMNNKPPKYFDNLYKKENVILFKRIKDKRIKLKENKEKVKDQTTSNDRLNQLEVEERTNNERSLKLIRAFEKQKK